jgi:hypothetical protein
MTTGRRFGYRKNGNFAGLTTDLACGAAALHHGASSLPPTRARDEAPHMLAHNVYFTLKDGSPEAKQRLVAACRKHLSQHPGTVFFAAGVRAEALQREVNVRDFDVGLHIIFTDQAAHDRYQDAPAHYQFVAENKDTWMAVRVFDSVVEGA